MRTRTHLAAIAMIVITGPPDDAAGSWRFPAAGQSRLDYDAASLVTGGATGAFSCFGVIKVDAPIDGDAFLLGAIGPDDLGWELRLDRAVAGSADEDRFRFWVSGGTDAETERYASAPADAGAWTAVGGSFAWDEAGKPDAMTLYVDGVADHAPARYDAGLAPALGAAPFTIGSRPDADAPATLRRLGYAAVWDGHALTADEHALLAAGADPRTIAPDHLVFYVTLEDTDAADLVGDLTPTVVGNPTFSVDRWPPARPLVVGCGDPTASTIRLLTHTGRPGAHRIEFTPDDFPGVLGPPVAAAPETDNVAAHHLEGLAPGTTYQYRLWADGTMIPASTAHFRTAVGGEAAFSFVYGSCSKFQTNNPPYNRYPFDAFTAVADRDPDFVVHGGDVWYADVGGHDEVNEFDAWQDNTVEGFVRKAIEVHASPPFDALRRDVPLFTMPDDHEWTNNVSGIGGFTGENRARADKAFGRILNWQFSTNPARAVKAVEDQGLWYTFTYGGVDFFFLDIRTQRASNSLPNDENKRILGPDDRQLQDLLEWLDTSTARFKVILSPGMISRYGSGANDAWGSTPGFSVDARRVIALLADYDDVAYFAGDVHWSGVTRLAAHPSGNPAHHLYEFIGSPFAGPVGRGSTSQDEEVVYVFDGTVYAPDRFSFLDVHVDTTRVPASLRVDVVSFNPATGAAEVVYTHPEIVSRRTCAGDVDRDGIVNTVDLIEILIAWGPCPPGRCPSDMDGDGATGLGDILVLLTGWGGCAP